MDKPSQRLIDLVKEIDEARNASPRVPQQPSEMVTDRNARLAEQAERIAALRRVREAAEPKPPATGDLMVKRELIDTGRDKRYVRRNSRGEFKESDDVGRSLAADRRRRAETKSKPGEGDKGDRPRPKIKRQATRKTVARQGAGRKSASKKTTERR